jgi:hypothetical protein
MSSKCKSPNCPQALFRDDLCIDHYRKEKGTSSKIVAPNAKEEVIDEKMRTKFKELTRSNYFAQAKWYLNAFWVDGAESQAEEVWGTAHKFVELDPKKKNGMELNEVQAHHFLQQGGKTMTALELRNELRRIDVDANGQMALLEYLLFLYKRLVTSCINNPQGGGPEEQKQLAEAQDKMNALQAALEQLTVQLETQRKTEAAAKEAESAAKLAEEKAVQAENALKAAEDEARAAAAELQRQDDEYKSKCATLEAKTKDQTTGTVSRNKAVQELAQLKGQDPLPLRKAKITQDAAVRKVEAERKLAEAARQKAEQQRETAEKGRAAAEEQTKRVEESLADTENKAKEAAAFLEELKKRAGVPHGAVWWMQREVAEARRFMPKSKQ